MVIKNVIACDVFSPKPSFRPVTDLNSLTVKIKRTPSLKFDHLVPIMKRISPAVKTLPLIEA